MEVVRALTAGFCMGVILALQKLDALVEDREAGHLICTLGPIIHNPQVLEEYARKGVSQAESFEDIPPEATVVIRAHGIPQDVEFSLRSRGIRIVDATCPKVKKAQLLIREQAREGRFILLYGEESHPEVRGLLSYAVSGTFVFDTEEKLGCFPLEPGRRYGLAAQTTQDREKFDAIAAGLTQGRDRDIAIMQTICDATKQRQEETVRIARDVEFMVVIGGLESGNTRRLAQVVAAQNKPCMHVESARELPLDEIRKFTRIGLTAGASTPKTLIDEAHRILEAQSAG
jgi:4-hydroxy-3-methylbut-2-en-1-yl diphosphate reductase